MSLTEDQQWLNARLRRNHFCRWLDLRVIRAADGEIDIFAPWREEIVSNPDLRFTHGGVLATLVDTAASFAIATRLGRPPQTIDMRVDYHAMAQSGDLVARGKILRLGRTIGSAEAAIFDTANRMVSSGRATFLVVDSKPSATNAASTG